MGRERWAREGRETREKSPPSSPISSMFSSFPLLRNLKDEGQKAPDLANASIAAFLFLSDVVVCSTRQLFTTALFQTESQSSSPGGPASKDRRD